MSDAPKQSSELIALAHSHWRLVHSTSGDVYVVPHDGPNIARPLRGSQSARAALATLYHSTHNKAPSTTALVEALTVLEGQGLEHEPEELALRCDFRADRLVVDLGRPDGAVATITAAGWAVAAGSDVTFRRTRLTGPLPHPERGGSLDELREHTNFTDESWPLARAFLVAGYFPDRACPVLALIARQGYAKTTTGSRLVALVDPSPAPLRHAPADPLDWTVMASASRLVGLDNVSAFAPWLSDAICRAVTGDGFVKRSLYTDSDVAIFAGRRAIILTTIDAGGLRGDFADRIVTIDLQPIDDRARREDAVLDAAFQAAYPRLLGALFDEIAAVLERLPTVRPAELPRMADYGRILAALDDLHGSHGLSSYLEARSRLAADVVEADPVAAAVRDLARRSGTWAGSPGELLDTITHEHPPKGWPADATRLSGRLRRIAPALGSIGIDVTDGRANGKRWLRVSTSAAGDLVSGTPTAFSGTASGTAPSCNGAGQTPDSAASAANDAKSRTSSVGESKEEGENKEEAISASPAALPANSDATDAANDTTSDVDRPLGALDEDVPPEEPDDWAWLHDAETDQ